MDDRFNEILQAVGDRKIANDMLNDCKDEVLREKLINYIQEKDEYVCNILSAANTKKTKVNTDRFEFNYNEEKLNQELVSLGKDI